MMLEEICPKQRLICGIALAFIAFAPPGSAHAQQVPNSPRPAVPEIAPVSIVAFNKADFPPELVTANYQQMIDDAKFTDTSPPVFTSATVDLTGRGQKAVFIRVQSPLSCNASGQCEIDLFDLMKTRQRLFSVVAENVALAALPQLDNSSPRFPLLLTDLPADLALSTSGNGPIPLETSRAAGVWFWNGKAYEAVP